MPQAAARVGLVLALSSASACSHRNAAPDQPARALEDCFDAAHRAHDSRLLERCAPTVAELRAHEPRSARQNADLAFWDYEHADFRFPQRSTDLAAAWKDVEPALRPAALDQADEATLHRLYVAVNAVADEIRTTEAIGADERVFALLGSRASRDEIRYRFALLVTLRRFDEARRLALAVPKNEDLERLPERIEGEPTGDAPAVLDLSADGTSLHRTVISFAAPRLVIVLTPDCHFSRDLLNALETHSDLRARMQRDSIMVVPQGSLDLDELAAWNRAHPDFPMHLVDDERRWPTVLFWNRVPFAFAIKNGAVVDSVGGWNGDAETLPALAHALDDLAK